MIAILLYGIINGLVIGLVALAFQINFRIYKMFDLSQAGIYVCASYFFISVHQVTFAKFSNISSILILVITCGFSWGLLLLIYHLIYKRFLNKNASSLTLMVIGLALYMVMINITAIFFGSDVQIIMVEGTSSKSIQLGTVVITYIQITQMLLSTIVLSIALILLNKKKIAQQITAISENKELFLTLGHNVSKTRNKALLVSGVLITCAAILKSIEFGIEPFTIGFQTLLLGIVAVLIGGIHSFKGAVLGGVFIGVINNLGAWFFSGEWQETIAFVVLLIILIFKKNGFFSVNLRLEE